MPLRIAYVVVILIATLSDLDVDLDLDDIVERLERMVMPSWSRRAMVDGARNLTLFAGWGLVWMLTVRGGLRWTHLRTAFLTGTALSITVECLQLLSGTRVASVLDIMTNSGGSLVGAGVVIVVVGALRGVGSDRSLIGVPAPVIAATYGCAVLAEAFVPRFRQDLRVVVAGDAWTRLLAALGDFESATLREIMVTDVLLFLPVGLMATAALVEMGVAPRSAGVRASLVAVPLLVAAEIAHGMMRIQIHGGAVSSHVAGVLLGAFVGVLTLSWLKRRFALRDRALLFGAAYALVLALWSLRPFSFDLAPSSVLSELRSDWWVPLRFVSARADLFTVVDLLNNFLLYLPLGVFLRVWPLRESPWVVPTLGVTYTLVLEVAQLTIASRTLDITDAAVQVVGIAVGWAIAERAGLPVQGWDSSSQAHVGPEPSGVRDSTP